MCIELSFSLILFYMIRKKKVIQRLANSLSPINRFTILFLAPINVLLSTFDHSHLLQWILLFTRDNYSLSFSLSIFYLYLSRILARRVLENWRPGVKTMLAIAAIFINVDIADDSGEYPVIKKNARSFRISLNIVSFVFTVSNCFWLCTRTDT